jgi:hypothetical protein
VSVLRGFIKDVRYAPQLTSKLPATYSLTDFEVNAAKHFGLIQVGTPENHLAFARWISPKRTRSYPFARLYDIFHYNTRKIAIIPVIKDEGADTANNDRINYMTFSWMSLLDVFIVLAWYQDAQRKPGTKDLITAQRMNAEHVRQKLQEISTYHLSALHWNTSHFSNDFEWIYRQAVRSYERIAQKHNMRLHSITDHLCVLDRYITDERFDLDKFKQETLARSLSAATREIQTSHWAESLSEGAKNLLYISNYLGGEITLRRMRCFGKKISLSFRRRRTVQKAQNCLPLMTLKMAYSN